MPSSPQRKTPAVFCNFLQIHNICGRADVGIGPYWYVNTKTFDRAVIARPFGRGNLPVQYFHTAVHLDEWYQEIATSLRSSQ